MVNKMHVAAINSNDFISTQIFQTLKLLQIIQLQ